MVPVSTDGTGTRARDTGNTRDTDMKHTPLMFCLFFSSYIRRVESKNATKICSNIGKDDIIMEGRSDTLSTDTTCVQEAIRWVRFSNSGQYDSDVPVPEGVDDTDTMMALVCAMYDRRPHDYTSHVLGNVLVLAPKKSVDEIGNDGTNAVTTLGNSDNTNNSDNDSVLSGSAAIVTVRTQNETRQCRLEVVLDALDCIPQEQWPVACTVGALKRQACKDWDIKNPDAYVMIDESSGFMWQDDYEVPQLARDDTTFVLVCVKGDRTTRTPPTFENYQSNAMRIMKRSYQGMLKKTSIDDGRSVEPPLRPVHKAASLPPVVRKGHVLSWTSELAKITRHAMPWTIDHVCGGLLYDIKAMCLKNANFGFRTLILHWPSPGAIYATQYRSCVPALWLLMLQHVETECDAAFRDCVNGSRKWTWRQLQSARDKVHECLGNDPFLTLTTLPERVAVTVRHVGTEIDVFTTSQFNTEAANMTWIVQWSVPLPETDGECEWVLPETYAGANLILNDTINFDDYEKEFPYRKKKHSKKVMFF